MLLNNTVSLDYTNKVTSWSPLNYYYTCRSALSPEDSQNRIKTRQGKKQLKRGSVEGTWIKPRGIKAQNQQYHSTVCAVPFWSASPEHERSLLVLTSPTQSTGDPRHGHFPKDTFCVLQPAQLKASPSDFELPLGLILHPVWEWETQQQKGVPTWTFSGSSGGCSFQEGTEPCHRASGKEDLKELVTDSKAPACRCKAWAWTTTKCHDYLQCLTGNMADKRE